MRIDLLICAVGMLACLIGMHKTGYDKGFADGASEGAMRMLQDFCEGGMRVEDGKLVISDKSVGTFFCDGEELHEVDLDKLTFEES